MPEHKVVVQPGPRSYRNCPVSVEVPGLAAGPIEVFDASEDRTFPAQLADGRTHWILDRLGRARARELVVRTTDRPPPENVTVRNSDGDRATVSVRGSLWTEYVYGPGVARPYLHPLVGPFGRPVTRAFPMENVPGETRDHPHHKGCWVAHGDVNGADDWSEGEGHATVAHREFVRLEGGPVFARIAARNDWLDNAGAKVVEEEREYRFHDLPESGRAFDLQVAFRATEGDVRFGDTKEGGIASVRVATTMDVKSEGRIENSFGGINETETWGKRAAWCDYSGPVAGNVVGVTMMDTPGNYRYPTYWHVRDYGLMTANPFGLSHFLRAGDRPGPDGSFVLPKNEELVFRYRIYVHAGDAQAGEVASKYHHYVNPPRIEVIA